MLDIDQINNLESENKRLNKELETAVGQYNAVVKQNKDLQTELNQYKKAAKEIKIIVKKLRTKTDYHSEKEVNADLDAIKEKIEKVNNG